MQEDSDPTASFMAASDTDIHQLDADSGSNASSDENKIYNRTGTKRRRGSKSTAASLPRTQSQPQVHHNNGEWDHASHQTYASSQSQQQSQQQLQQQLQRPRKTSQCSDSSQRPHLARRSVSFHEDSKGSNSLQSPSQHLQHQNQNPHHNESHRVPYFRYFGPTAIVPGYKQMVVDISVCDRRRSHGSSLSTSSPDISLADGGNYQRAQRGEACPSGSDSALRNQEDLPLYDPTDSAPVHPLIINLVKTFFVHLGCNYPFLREDRMLRMVREKRVEAILVYSICALAARFSDLPVFASGSSTVSRSHNGHFYAQRAKAATVDTFPCPSVAAVQACLLMAYEGFGADQDSALWMYLGLAIRMAVDLGLQKKLDVAPQPDQAQWFLRFWDGKHGGDSEGGDGEDDDSDTAVGSGIPADKKASSKNNASDMQDAEDALVSDELRALEQERADTFWAVFFLDRVISSGTGRPVTFRDDDFELALPEPMLDPRTKWPAPFPILVQIIHLYGQVSDVLNNIRSADDLTHEKMQRLGRMESDLTQLYQKQDPRLNFNAANFQAYVRAGQGTTFILLHFWFHTLIIILHQPAILVPFGGLRRMHQLLPNSHELSMSSAKTIADILAFAELIDPKSFIGNPFTSQPMYVAACAFLMESAANASLPASRDASPPLSNGPSRSSGFAGGNTRGGSSKHSLLASNANQNYQRCYKSLQQLHVYWGGVRYILTALDQKSKGIWDCETFTSEEMGSARQSMRRGSLSQMPRLDNPSSPNAPPIAWSLTGTSNSANPSLTVLFQTHQGTASSSSSSSSLPSGTRAQDTLQQQQQQRDQHGHCEQSKFQVQQHPRQANHQNHYRSPQLASAATPPGNMIYDPIRQSLPELPATYPSAAHPQANVSAVRYSNHEQQRYQQQHNPHAPPHPFSEASLPGQSNGNSSDHVAYTGEHQQGHQTQSQQHQMQQQYSHHYHNHNHNHNHRQGQDQHIQQQDFTHQPQYQSQQQHLPAPVQSYNTPTSHHSSGFDGVMLTGTSPSNNGLSSFGQGNSSVSGNSPRTVNNINNNNNMGNTDGNGVYQDFMPSSLMSGHYSYMEAGPITDVVTFDSQEIDIGSLVLPPELMPLWLEYVPTNVLNLFDDGTNRSN